MLRPGGPLALPCIAARPRPGASSLSAIEHGAKVQCVAKTEHFARNPEVAYRP
jgi:hypothetical protein